MTKLQDAPRIAFVGVGRMGSAMLECVLRAGQAVVLYDPSAAALAPFVSAYPELVRVARTARDAAAAADLIEVVVNTNEQLLEACLSADGILAGAAPGSAVLVHATVSRPTLQTLERAASERSVHVLDAMVSGPQGHLSIPKLAVMVGGDAAAFERAKPVMETYGSLVLRLGPVGAGLDAKLALNMLRYLCMIAAQEATWLAARTGVGDAFGQLVAHADATRFTADIGALALSHNAPEQRRRTDAVLGQKDLRAAIERGAEYDLKLPSAELAVSLMHRLWAAEPQGDRE